MPAPFSELRALAEWDSVHIPAIGNPDKWVEDFELVLSIPDSCRSAVLYCLPWKSSLFDPALDTFLRRIARDNAVGCVLILDSTSTTLDRNSATSSLPSHLVQMCNRLKIGLLCCDTQHFPRVWAAGIQRLASVEFSRLRSMQSALEALVDIVREAPSPEEFADKLALKLDVHVRWTTQHATAGELTHRVKVGNQTVGYLTENGPNPKLLRELWQVIGIFASTTHLVDMTQVQTRVRFQSDLLDTLLSENVDLEVLSSASRRAGLDVGGMTRAIVFTNRDKASAGDVHLWERVFSNVENTVKKARVPSLHGYNQGCPVFLLQPKSDRTSGADDILAEIAHYCREQQVQLGVSSLRKLSAGGHALFQEALEAATIGRALRSSDPIIFSETLGRERLFYSILTSPFARALAQNLLEPLLKSDLQDQTDYLRTLSEYLSHSGRVTDTAQALNLHRNSLRYRLSKIKEILGFDIDDPSKAVLLHFALFAHRVHFIPAPDTYLDINPTQDFSDAHQ